KAVRDFTSQSRRLDGVELLAQPQGRTDRNMQKKRREPCRKWSQWRGSPVSVVGSRSITPSAPTAKVKLAFENALPTWVVWPILNLWLGMEGRTRSKNPNHNLS